VKLAARYRQLGPRRFARWVLIKRVGKPIFRRIDRLMASQSRIGNPEIFDAGLVPWVAGLEAAAPKIRAELDRLLEHRDRLPRFIDIQPDQGKINPDAGWKTFFFSGFGVGSEHNRALCPETARALDRIPNVELALFSILAPGLHIPRHAGVSKGLIRCHLALKVPRDSEKVVMHIGSTRFHWQEGRAIVFDDTYKHEVFNGTDEERVVLIVDTPRPMRWPGRVAWSLMRAVLLASPFVRDSRRNHERWEKESGGVFERPPAGIEALV
jgi:beta-hydroxylase